MSEKGKFWLNRWNIIDVFIFFAVIGSILVTCAYVDGLHHSTGNSFGAVMVAARYTLQIVRFGMLIKVSKEIHDQKKYQGMISLKPGLDLENDTMEGTV